MNIINKFFERLSRLFRCFVSKNYKLSHKYQNKNQITNAELILDILNNDKTYLKFKNNLFNKRGNRTYKNVAEDFLKIITLND